MMTARAATGTAAAIGPLAVSALDYRAVSAAVALSVAVLTTTLPALPAHDAHRYEDTALLVRPAVTLSEEPESIKRIRALAAYEAGWDGPDSVGPTLQTVRHAVAFARDLQALEGIARPYISLANDGEINFYWDTPHLKLDLGFTGTGQYSYYGRTPDGRDFIEDGADLSQALPLDLIAALRA